MKNDWLPIIKMTRMQKGEMILIVSYGPILIFCYYFSVLRSEIHLHEAARKNSVDRVRKLITDRVDVNSRNNVSYMYIESMCNVF